LPSKAGSGSGITLRSWAATSRENAHNDKEQSYGEFHGITLKKTKAAALTDGGESA